MALMTLIAMHSRRPMAGWDAQSIGPFLPWIGGALALLCLWLALRENRRRRWVDDTPTSKTTGIFIGLVEVKGTAETDRPLVSQLAERPCVHYAWSVEEHWSRTVTETYRDSDGKTKTRTRHESGWTNVGGGSETVPFYLQDDLGEVLVRPARASIEPLEVFSRTCHPNDPLYYAKGPAHAVSHSDHYRQFTERAIPLHAPLYVMGQARERQDVVAAEIAYDADAPMFLISCRSEEQIGKGMGTSYWVWAIVGLMLAIAGAVGGKALRLRGFSPDKASLYVAALAATLVYGLAWALSWVWSVFNSLIGLRNRVRRAWSLIDVQLKRRADLIPNLVEAVKGLRDHERDVQIEISSLRAQMDATPPGQAGADYQACAKPLQAVVERYPQLRAQDSFLRLQQSLVETEQRIALARGYFNEIATYYNTRLQQVPDRFVAGIARLEPRPLMAANDFERAPVNVGHLSADESPGTDASA